MKKNNKTNSNSELKTLAEIVYNSIYNKSLPKYKYYLMDHRGGLKEALETLEQINVDKFKKLHKKYTFYGYDDRIECLRFILDDIEHDNSHVWLMISQLDLDEIKNMRC